MRTISSILRWFLQSLICMKFNYGDQATSGELEQKLVIMKSAMMQDRPY